MSDDQRHRILVAALGLMADRGARGMSMRSLARACDLNVATLYHYFPSKVDIVRAALAHGRTEQLFEAPFPDGPQGSIEDRLAVMLDVLAVSMTVDDAFWRAILAEAVHGEPEVLGPILEMHALFEVALTRWLAEFIPEAPALHTPEMVQVMRFAFYGMVIVLLPQPVGRREAIRESTRQLAAVFAQAAAPIPDPNLI